MKEMRVLAARKIIVELELSAGIWMSFGVNAEKAISLEEAKKRALELEPPMRPYCLEALESLKGVRQMLIGRIVETGCSDLLDEFPTYRYSRAPFWSTDIVRITQTNPEGPVKITPHTNVEIWLRLRKS